MEIDKEKIDQVLSQSAESNCPVVSASVLSAEAIIYRGDFGLAEVSAKKIKFIYFTRINKLYKFFINFKLLFIQF